MNLPHIPLVVLDTETTGFIPKVNRIIEYAHMVVREGEIVDEYEQLISIPDNDIPEHVQIITRIKPEALRGQPTFDNIRERIKNKMGADTLIVGQNVSFDIRMLGGEGIDISERPWIDTSMLASLVFPELESYSLGYVSTVLELNHAPVHRALGDVRATLELLEKCWGRLLELPKDATDEIKTIMSKSSPGYKILFDALPTNSNTEKPSWMTMPPAKKVESSDTALELRKPAVGIVDLIEEPLDPSFLQNIVDSAAKDTSTVHWIAVKNLTATVKRLTLSKDVRVLQPPFLMLDDVVADSLRTQEIFSSDEASLLTKLDWYHPSVISEAPVHGGEKSVWGGKLACTDESASYTDQFTNLPSVILLDHRQLLAFIDDPDHAAHGALNSDAHIIIDDASMLEDTANKAYGQYCSFNDLRAAAEGNDKLTKFTDLLQIWIEKIRHDQDVRFITRPDIESPQASALREQIIDLQSDTTLRPQTQRLLSAALACLSPEAATRITWMETRQDGSQYLHSVPESVAELMKKQLYDVFPVTVIIPPKSAELLQETLHRGTQKSLNTVIQKSQINTPISFPENLRGGKVIADPPDGKTIILAGSRRVIEEYFIKYTEDLESRDITLICQNFSGGQNRMQAEFLAAKSPVVWVITPWMFEGLELPAGTVDHLVMDAIPFDNPSSPVFGKRAEHFDNAFLGYSMPRLFQRLFRIVRTFRRIASDTADISVIDARIIEKRYGSSVKKYMEMVCKALKSETKAEFSNSDYPENWQLNLF